MCLHRKTAWGQPFTVRMLDRGQYVGERVFQRRRCEKCQKVWERRVA